jgi:hypothetical protein
MEGDLDAGLVFIERAAKGFHIGLASSGDLALGGGGAEEIENGDRGGRTGILRSALLRGTDGRSGTSGGSGDEVTHVCDVLLTFIFLSWRQVIATELAAVI